MKAASNLVGSRRRYSAERKNVAIVVYSSTCFFSGRGPMGDHMRVRADRSLYDLLCKTIELGCSDEVASRIRDAKDHMGHQSPFRGNRDLVEMIEFAAEKAEGEGDTATVQRLRDTAAYAKNEVLGPDLEIRYELRSGSLDHYVQFVAGSLASVLTFVLGHLKEVYGESSEVNLPEILDHLGKLRDNTERLQPVPGQPGYFRLPVRGSRELGEWVAKAIREKISVVFEGEEQSGELPPGVTALVDDERVVALLDGLALRRERDSLLRLKSTVLNPNALEKDLQQALERNTWVFGGRYVNFASRRLFAPQTEIDLPLLRPDGVLHVVEIKRATSRVVTHQRGRLVPTAEVHRAVGQVANYLVTLDEMRDQIRDEWGIDVRLAQATVVIGHPHHGDQDARAVHQALRIYNTCLASRVEVITYQELLESAERSLALTD